MMLHFRAGVDFSEKVTLFFKLLHIHYALCLVLFSLLNLFKKMSAQEGITQDNLRISFLTLSHQKANVS